MDHPRSTSGNGDDNVGIPDDLRCKRSDGKQWRCTAMSMPDKTVCEKHYIQAKKRAANSALRASMKKAKRKSLGESDIYLESKSDDMDVPINNAKDGDYPASASGKKYKEKVPKSQVQYSPETSSMKSFSTRNTLKANDLQRDGVQYEENRRSYKTPPPSAVEPSENRSEKVFDASAMTETSDGSSDSSEDNEGQTCHQCRQNDRDGVIWCLRCDRRGYCSSCISTWYSDITLEEIRKICPACRGTCNCKICLRGDNLVKARIREIPVQDKLQYLHCLLSSVLPVVKQINREQCFEWELEKKLRGDGVDLPRTKLNADEQILNPVDFMPSWCGYFVRALEGIEIICALTVMYFLAVIAVGCLLLIIIGTVQIALMICALAAAKILGKHLLLVSKEGWKNQIDGRPDQKVTLTDQVNPPKLRLKLSDKFPNWKANSNASIPCPPKEYSGCGCLSLTLKRIFKTNWVAKLVKISEEMVNGCKVFDVVSPEETGFNTRLCQCAHREDNNDNFLYCSTSEDIKIEGIGDFRKHWIQGEPVIVKEVCDGLSMTSWHPMVIWRGIRETTEEKMKDDNRIVKAIDCLDGSEIKIELGQFVKGYSEGRIQKNGWQQMLKLKDWPSPSASEEFLLYQRPEFISKMPLLEYIHSKCGLLNVAAKLPHYSLQNDVGRKIFVSYGMYEELGRGDSVNNLHFSMCDMVYLLVHTCEVKLKGGQRENIEKIQKTFDEAEAKEPPDTNMNKRMDREVIETSTTLEENTVNCEDLSRVSGEIFQNTHPGAVWDVFRRQDVPKLMEYLRVHWKDFGKTERVEPWSFEQHLGQAVFIPAGCPFQERNLQFEVSVFS
ncbi:JmjC domain protein JMJ24 [Actinidia rufa]|uniref:JmjC domain protein JMJ24 n=1 Tax=Actinidia rufa TaxID=165716 RepID=A0A7J0FWA4_9ERIC|nr:JmjC domain protein JMJ24 [Actinidia rufa]